uniref:Uncharacterized protein n=1 Tax=Arion vulgaris TaxID=1028688 RepID=A0A0B7A2W8_9EUPU
MKISWPPHLVTSLTPRHILSHLATSCMAARTSFIYCCFYNSYISYTDKLVNPMLEETHTYTLFY